MKSRRSLGSLMVVGAGAPCVASAIHALATHVPLSSDPATQTLLCVFAVGSFLAWGPR